MAGETGDFGIVASLNIAATLRNVENDLKKIESQLKPIQISAQLNTGNIKSQTAQVQQQINSVTKTASSAVNIPINFKASAEEVKGQLAQLVAQIRKEAQGTVIDYKVNLSQDGNIDNILLKYKNAANQISDSIIKLQDMGDKLPDGTANLQWVESLKSVSQNIEQTIKQNEKLTESQQKQANRISELTSQYSKFQAQLSKNDKGISLSSLNQENVSGLQNALNTNNIQQATHYLRLLKTEYSELNEAMDKPFSSNALEKLETRAEKLSRNIDVITSKFSQVHLDNRPGFANQVNQTTVNVQKLQENLDKFNSAKVGPDKVAAFNELNKSVSEAKVQVNDLFKAQKDLDRLSATSNRFEAFLNDNVKVAKQFPDAVAKIRSELQGLNSETDMTKLNSGLQNVRGQISALEASAKSVGATGRTIFGELGNDIKKMLTWTVGGTLIFGTVNQIKQMAQNVKSLDEALVNIQMATGDTRAQASQLMDTYNQMGQQLGATTVDVANSADNWLRQGKSISDTNTLIKDSMVLSKVGEIDSADATNYLTSAMKGYNVSVQDASEITDKLAKVDMESASSAGGLAEGMSKTANMAQLAGRMFARPYSDIWVA